MNERIKELALQSGGDFWQRLENDSVKENAYITFDPPESLEKFVELIVRECIEQASIGNGHGNNQWDRALTFATKNIKQHFGVEE